MKNTYDAKEYIGSKLAGMQVVEEQVDDTNISTQESEYLEIFDDVQQYVVKERISELEQCLDSQDNGLLNNIVSSYIDSHYPDMLKNPHQKKEIVRRCIDDMTGYGFLNRYFARKDEIEEININGWNNIEVRWCHGRRELTDDHFHNAQHARDVIIRILRSTGKYLDDNKIYEVSYIGKSVRIATVITPIADKEVGVAASIRFIHSSVYTIERLVETEFMTEEMARSLQGLVNHGVSVCVCGATGSGKTTVLNALLRRMANDTRIITLEAGTREFELLKYDENGKVINNRLHLQTRPHRDPNMNVDLQMLLDLVLKFDPDMVVVGEMVSEEAFIASETARTGHTVMTTIHSNNAYDAYYRMFSLGMRKYNLNEKMMLKFMVDAFPIIVYVKQYPDGKRRIQSILEGQYVDDKVTYNEIYHYEVTDNEEADGKIKTVGRFVHLNSVTDKLKTFMMDNGATKAEVDAF